MGAAGVDCTVPDCCAAAKGTAINTKSKNCRCLCNFMRIHQLCELISELLRSAETRGYSPSSCLVFRPQVLVLLLYKEALCSLSAVPVRCVSGSSACVRENRESTAVPLCVKLHGPL